MTYNLIFKAIPYLVSPLEFAQDIYKATTFKFQRSAAQDNVQKNQFTHESDTRIKQLALNNLTEKMRPFLDKVKVRKDLIIYVETRFPVENGVAIGTNFFTNSDAVIALSPKLYDADKNVYGWILKHEISHIKYNDCFTRPLVGAVASVTTAIVGSIYLSVIPTTILCMAAGSTTYSLFSQWQESRADDFATKESSDEELKGGRVFLKTMADKSKPESKAFLFSV